MINKRITKLRKLININKLDGYVVPKNDAYFSEFSLPDRLKSISNFSGSAGYAIILKNKNFLFVDGRYTIQAKKECGKNFKVLEIPKFSPKDILKFYNKKIILGIDPQLFTSFSIDKKFKDHFKILEVKDNLIDKVCKKQERKFVTPFYSLSKKISGESINSKINRLIKKIKSKDIDNIFISAPENVAWLLNLRGRDSFNSPIPNSKIILTKNKNIYFFSCPKKIFKMKSNKKYKNLKYSTYKNFSEIVKNLKGKNFCIDKTTCSIFNEKIIKNFFKIKLNNDPCYLLKSIKNPIEISNMINTHIIDGVALTKFIYWIKKINKKKINEVEAQNKLEKFRKINKKYLLLFFLNFSNFI